MSSRSCIDIRQACISLWKLAEDFFTRTELTSIAGNIMLKSKSIAMKVIAIDIKSLRISFSLESWLNYSPNSYASS